MPFKIDLHLQRFTAVMGKIQALENMSEIRISLNTRFIFVVYQIFPMYNCCCNQP